MKSSSLFDIEGTLVIVDSFKEIVDAVTHYSDSQEPLFCSERREFSVNVKVYSVDQSYRDFYSRTGCG